MLDILFRTQKVTEVGKNLFKRFKEHRTQEKEHQESVERRLKKYTTEPLPKPTTSKEKEKSEKDGNNV